MRNSIFAPLYMIGALLGSSVLGHRPSHAHPTKLIPSSTDLHKIQAAKDRQARKLAKRQKQRQHSS